MSLSKDGAGVSEIVGALLLVVVVSSAVVGFGMFVSQQAKLTQEQKAAELERSLETLEISGVTPTDLDDATCAATPDGASWNQLTFRVTSLHLKDTEITGLRVNGHVVRNAVVEMDAKAVDDADLDTGSDVVSGSFSAADVGRRITGMDVPADTFVVSFDEEDGSIAMSKVAGGEGDGEVTLGDLQLDFQLLPGEEGHARWTLGARGTDAVTLEDVVDGTCAPTPGTYSFFGSPPATPPIGATDAIEVEVLTGLANTFERAFVPPTAIISVGQHPFQNGGSVDMMFLLDGALSQADGESGFLTQWQWAVMLCSTPACADTPGAENCAAMVAGEICRHSGKTVRASELETSGDYRITLQVRDRFGLVASSVYDLST